eukprot:4223872-Amphidinium_carterae.1
MKATTAATAGLDMSCPCTEIVHNVLVATCICSVKIQTLDCAHSAQNSASACVHTISRDTKLLEKRRS